MNLHASDDDANARKMEDLNAAERRIAAILADLEHRHPGHCVTGIGLETIEATAMGDRERNFWQRVVIELRPNPRNRWLT